MPPDDRLPKSKRNITVHRLYLDVDGKGKMLMKKGVCTLSKCSAERLVTEFARRKQTGNDAVMARLRRVSIL